jgi:hypothetical protein
MAILIPIWSQQSNLSWHAQVPRNPAPQFHGKSYSFHCSDANMQLLEYIAKAEAYQEEPSPQFCGQSYSYLRQSIFKIEAQEEEPSPIYDHSYSYPHQQYQDEPPPPKRSTLEEASFALKEEMSAYLSQMEESKRSLERMENSHKQSFERMEAHLKQILDILKEEEEECQSQSVTTPHGYNVEEEDICYHEDESSPINWSQHCHEEESPLIYWP